MKKFVSAVLFFLVFSTVSFAKDKPRVDGKFKVTVDYSQAVKQMVEAGHYDWKNPNINHTNFPIPPSKRGKKEVTIGLVSFNRNMELNEILQELDRMGFRPAELPELLAFGTAYPEKQREFPIVALGSVWRYWFGHRRVAYLCSRSGRRILRLRYFVDRWNSDYRFAAVRK